MEALEMTLLFDYYGDLLTDRQRACLDLRYNHDLSLGEIAAELGVSRQGVYDNINRAETLLHNIEDKTGCVSRSLKIRKSIQEILKTAQYLSNYPDATVSSLASQIIAVAQDLEE